jgi:hypothetical protein
MTDKIRIVGSFGENVVEQTAAFVDGLQGVDTVAVLRDGVDIFPHDDAADTSGDTEPEAA